MAAFSENRRTYRFPFRTKFIFATDKEVFAGNTMNLSSGGVFVASLEADIFRRDSSCLCVFQLAPDEAPLRMTASVQRIVALGAHPDETPGIGLGFGEDDTASHERLNQFTDNCRKNFEAAYTILTAGEPDRSSLDPLIAKLHLPPSLDLGELRFQIEKVLRGIEELDSRQNKTKK